MLKQFLMVHALFVFFKYLKKDEQAMFMQLLVFHALLLDSCVAQTPHSQQGAG